MTTECYFVDAFTERAFAGNPAAVCLLPTPRDTEWMQQVAAEFNLSETAFLTPLAPTLSTQPRWQLRWFTPQVEVDLCGHATLASAHVLWAECGEPAATLAFETRSGELLAQREQDAIRLDFPAKVPRPAQIDPTLEAILGQTSVAAVWGGPDLLVELASAEAVRQLQPDTLALAQLSVRGLLVTARSDNSDADFVSRFFAPSVGIPEDPVTGSAHCLLAPYWAAKLGKNRLQGYQASRRGGFVGVELRGERVLLSGKAITTLKGQLHVD